MRRKLLVVGDTMVYGCGLEYERSVTFTLLRNRTMSCKLALS